MNQGRYVFTQLEDFLPRKNFEWLVKKYEGYKFVKRFKGEKGKRPQGLHTLGSLLFSAPIGGILFRQLRVGSYRNPIEYT